MKNILKQTSWLFFSQVLTRIIGFFYIIYLAKALGVIDFGLYTAALAYFSIISSLADFGFNRFLIREVARDRSKLSELLCNTLILRLTLASVLFVIFAIALSVLDPNKARIGLILLATIAILPQSVAFTFDAVFVAFQKLHISAIALFLLSLSTVFFGFLLVNRGFSSLGALSALLIGQLVYAAVLITLFLRNHGMFLSPIKLAVLKSALVGSLPYGLLAILGLLYFKIDTLLLSYMRGNFETGIYGVAYKFLEAIIFIPSALSLALFPVLARMHDKAPQDLKSTYFKSFKIMLLVGLLVFFCYILILPAIIKSFLPNYLPAVTVIKILSLSIPFMFIHVPAVTILLSTDKYLKMVLLLSVFMVLINIGANLVLIPKFGFVGASWVTVISEIISFAAFFIFIKNKVLNESNI